MVKAFIDRGAIGSAVPYHDWLGMNFRRFPDLVRSALWMRIKHGRDSNIAALTDSLTAVAEQAR